MILNVGLEPREGSTHFPVIRTELRRGPELEAALALEGRATHLLLTSPRARMYWEKVCERPWRQEVWAIGEATAVGADRYAPVATQEGMTALFADWSEGFVLLPQSSRSRLVLRNFLQERGVAYYPFVLYETVLQCPGPPPDLEEVEEVIFTSPSTVAGFCAIYGRIPPHIKCRTIGPVTFAALQGVCYNADF